MSIKELAKKVIYWLFIAFLIYIIFELIRKILGGSLGFEELVIALLVGNIGVSYKLYTRISDVNARVSEHLGWHKGVKNGKKR